MNRPRSSEVHPGPGYRIQTDFMRFDPAVMKEFLTFETPDVSDLLNRLYAVDAGIRPLTSPEHVLCGPACTVRLFPGDNLMVHKALDIAQPGDVVVIDAGGSPTNAVLGDIICTKAIHRGIAGFIVDGLIRDLPGILELDIPVYARGTTAIGPLHRGPGEINYPICCGGVVVNPGDVVVADQAGTVIVPQDGVLDVLRRLHAHRAKNTDYLERVRRGEFSNAWVDDVLTATECYIHDNAPLVEDIESM